MVHSKKERIQTEINTGSMADIAFLLLIFFLVTTTILSEEGIRVKLPPFDPNSTSIPISSRNKFDVRINAQDKLLVEGQELALEQLREGTKEFIMNPQQLPNLASSPQKAVISLINDRKTSYERYIQVYNEVKGAYNELWEDAAQQRYQRGYIFLNAAEKKEIRQGIPLLISEAEPTDY